VSGHETNTGEVTKGTLSQPIGRNVTSPYTIKPISYPTHLKPEDGECMFLETSISAQNTTSVTTQKTMILTITTVKTSKLILVVYFACNVLHNKAIINVKCCVLQIRTNHFWSTTADKHTFYGRLQIQQKMNCLKICSNQERTPTTVVRIELQVVESCVSGVMM
jgi:hypothetical protein